MLSVAQGLIDVMGLPFKAPLHVSDLFLGLKPSHPLCSPPIPLPSSLTAVPSPMEPLCLAGGDGQGGPELILHPTPWALLHPSIHAQPFPLSLPSVMVSCLSLFHPHFPSLLSQSML